MVPVRLLAVAVLLSALAAVAGRRITYAAAAGDGRQPLRPCAVSCAHPVGGVAASALTAPGAMRTEVRNPGPLGGRGILAAPGDEARPVEPALDRLSPPPRPV